LQGGTVRPTVFETLEKNNLMPDYLAIDWEQKQLCGLVADVGSGSVRVSKCFTLTWPDGLTPAESPVEAGEWLKKELRELGISNKEAIVTVPREDAVVRHLELPSSPDSDLPDLVRFQASTKSAMSLDKLYLDYLHLPQRDDFEGRDVLMTTVTKEAANTIQSVLLTAGIKLTSLGLAPVAISELIARIESVEAPNHGEATLVIGRHSNRVEIAIFRDRHLLLAHSTRLVSDDAEDQQIQSILTETSRSFVALQKQLHDIKIGRAWILGSEEETQALVSKVKMRTSISTIVTDDCEVSYADPLAAPNVKLVASNVSGNRALYAGPIGQLLSMSGSTVQSVDFLHPRKKAVAKDTRKLKAVVAAVAVIVLTGIGFGVRYYVLKNYDAAIQTIEIANKATTKKIDRKETTLVTYQAVSKWKDANVNWLDQANELSAIFDGTDRYYLNELRFDQGTGSYLGRVIANGAAKTDDDVYALIDRIEMKNSHDIVSKAVPKESRDSRYEYKLQIEMNLKPPEESPPDKTKKKANGTVNSAAKTPKGGSK
jgi:hypothetical protein